MNAVQKRLLSAIPAMKAFEAAVDCLSVNSIIDFAVSALPPPGTELVTRAIQILKGVTHKRQLVDWGA